MTPITKEQATKILKALVYSFASGFVGVLALVGLDFINAAMNGQAAIVNLVTALFGASVIGGINAVFVTIKQLLTPAEK
jgi:TRAP-type C4-dicarboxylate transport system permease small subunit